ncbi:MAG TPA: biosynthetic peptidoglycan transglycosylase [Steroidobacteraceae bacterium]|nr:biosynthetic peptidoglycan transglycosylase [Steroidobacteraceae bacterium]
MLTFKTRARRWLGVTLAAALFASLAAVMLKPMLERAVRERIESAARRHGMVARMGSVHVGVWPFVRLDGFDLDLGHGTKLHADRIAATYPGRLRLEIGAANLAGPAGLELNLPVTAWHVAGIRGGDLQLSLLEPQAGLAIRQQANVAGSGWNIEARRLDIGHLLEVQREDHPLLEGGIADGSVNLQSSTDALRFHVDVGARGARFAALADDAGDEPRLGAATDVTLRFDGVVRRAEGTIEIPDLQGTFAGAELSGSIALRDLETDPSVDLTFGVRQLEFGRMLGAAGLAVPESLGMAPGGNDLGTATIEVSARGRASDPGALAVSQKVNFTPPRQLPPGISRLRGDFVYRSGDGPVPHQPIDVSPSSPDFIALQDVPPLFVRTLLLSEDAGFYGHRGIDLRELPSALLTNYSRGGAARGASTITQQLAKNLFLSRDKEVGRKLQELAITFLLESALGKDRILEIYLNIIEWGPDLRGLRPAARHYFGCEPQALTPAQMAFLVAIIPGPIKYQRSFAHGTPGPGLRLLIDNLLAKLRSVDAISEEDYQRALGEDIVVAGVSRPE